MKYNLTDKQKELARQIVASVRNGDIQETFTLGNFGDFTSPCNETKVEIKFGGGFAALRCLEQNKLLMLEAGRGPYLTCTVMGALYRAVDTNFAEDERLAPISTLAQPHPPEIAMSLDRLRSKYPDPKKLGFLVMRFTPAKPYERIVKIIKIVAEKHDLAIVRADEQEFHADLWGNVRTYLHGCGFGVAVYERIETNEPNANVGLEVGYLLAMSKPVLLLKDKTLPNIQSDLAGRLYKPFDPHDPESTIPPLMEKWLTDNGIILPGGV